MLSDHIGLICVYMVSIAICDYAVTVGNAEISPKHKDYKKFKEDYSLIKFFCFVPLVNTGYAVYYLKVWIKAFLFQSKK